MKKLFLISIFIFVSMNISFGILRRTKPKRSNYSVLFVVDVSGSMGGYPLMEVQQIVDKTINSVPKKSYMGLISFSGCGSSYVNLDVPVARSNHDEMRSRVNSLSAGGATDIVLALKYAENESKRLPGICTNVVVLTDGADTCNTETAAEIAGRISSVNSCNAVNVVSMSLVEEWESDFFDDIARRGRGQHRENSDYGDIITDLEDIIEEPISQNGGGNWSGDYSGGDNSGNNGGDGNRRPPTRPQEEEESETPASSEQGSSQDNQNQRRRRRP